MLCENDPSKCFWVVDINIANIVHNKYLIETILDVNIANIILSKYLSKTILKKTPHKLSKGTKHKMSCFRAFGCKCFIYNNRKGNFWRVDAISGMEEQK